MTKFLLLEPPILSLFISTFLYMEKKVGQRVIPFSGSGFIGDGTWQEFVKVRQDQLLHVPDGVSDEVAAQFFVNPCTVVVMILFD
jgi:NADPH:quinone reductase-like Zn-dependent oxidoreductase